MCGMIERVACGLRFVMYGVPPDRPMNEDSPWLTYARTAIHDMREPTIEMHAAGTARDDGADRTNSLAVYQAMIDAAIAPAQADQS